MNMGCVLSRFENLSPLDFEALVRDLFAAETGHHLETFASGRDGGIDVRLIGKGSRRAPDLIIQCKHYERSGFDKLLSQMKKEYKTAAKLQAKRYVLATTVSMTAPRKSRMVNELNGLLACDSDIYGLEDIESLLRDHPEVEKAHFRLWLDSTAILDRIVHAEVLTQTELHLNELEQTARTFVDNVAFNKVRGMLADNHVCIISGPAGVGKTTLANMILIEYIQQGFQPIVITKDLSQGQELFVTNRRQIFLYDDFLGRTTNVDTLGKNEDTRIAHFIAAISKAGSKRFVMTTRHYILERAREFHEAFDAPVVRKREYFFEMRSYSTSDKAHILYNHLYFSDLSIEHKAEIVRSRRYTAMIESDNFTPRAVETAIQLALLQNVTPVDVADFLVDSLEHPSELWRVQMTRHFTFEQKVILCFLVLHGGRVRLKQLESFYISSENNLQQSQAFDSAMRGLEGSALELQSMAKEELVTFSNPGVEDAVLEHLLPIRRILSALVEASGYDELVVLWNHANDIPVSKDASRGLRTRTLVAYSSAPMRLGLQVAFESMLIDMLKQAIVSLRRAWEASTWFTKHELELSNLLIMSKRLKSTDSSSLDLQVLGDALCVRWTIGKGNKKDTLVLLRVLLDTGMMPFHPELHEQLIEEAVSFLVNGTNSSPEDFYAMVGLADRDNLDLSSYPSVSVPFTKEELKERALEFAIDAWEWIEARDDLSAMRDHELEELREEAHKWAGLLDDLGLDQPDEYGRALGMVDEAEATIPEEADWEGSPLGSTLEAYNVDALFGTLTEG